MKYDGKMDKECIDLCDTLNDFEGIKTFESCCGHLKSSYIIWFRVNNFYSLSVLARAFDERYSNGKWKLEVQTLDTTEETFPTLCIMLCRKDIFNSYQEMMKEIDYAIANIYYWKQKIFKKHLQGVTSSRKTKVVSIRRKSK